MTNEFVDHMISLQKMSKVSNAQVYGEALSTDILSFLNPDAFANIHAVKILNFYLNDKGANFDIAKQCTRVEKEVRSTMCSFFKSLNVDETYKNLIIHPES